MPAGKGSRAEPPGVKEVWFPWRQMLVGWEHSCPCIHFWENEVSSFPSALCLAPICIPAPRITVLVSKTMR